MKFPIRPVFRLSDERHWNSKSAPHPNVSIRCRIDIIFLWLVGNIRLVIGMETSARLGYRNSSSSAGFPFNLPVIRLNSSRVIGIITFLPVADGIMADLTVYHFEALHKSIVSVNWIFAGSIKYQGISKYIYPDWSGLKCRTSTTCLSAAYNLLFHSIGPDVLNECVHFDTVSCPSVL